MAHTDWVITPQLSAAFTAVAASHTQDMWWEEEEEEALEKRESSFIIFLASIISRTTNKPKF